MLARSSSKLLALALAAAVGAATACGSDGPQAAAPPEEVPGEGADAGAEPLCVDGQPTGAYPPGPHVIELLGTVPPDLSFEGLDGPVRLASFFEPCAERARILIVRTGASFCGPCRWHAENTKRIMDDPRLAGRLALVDLLVSDEDNAPATAASLARWREIIDAPGALAIDPRYRFAAALLSRETLPVYAFIDTRTMTILATMSDPDPVSLASRLELELAELDGAPRPALARPPVIDELFTENEMDLIRGMRLVGEPPPDPTNAFADLPEAAALGKALFSDALLSPSGTVSCETCHEPRFGMGDAVGQAVGVAKGDRNSPPIALAAHARWQFWDGRADTLWMQALGPFEDERELASSRLFVAQEIARRYRAEYDAVFGATHPLPADALARMPEAGKPGDAAYDALSPADKDAVTRVYVNVGKAIAAFERTIRVKPNALDRYADGELDALTADQKRGLLQFMRNGCVQCHWGPRLTNDAFHVLRFPTGRQDNQADVGREDGLLRLGASEFTASSKWSDDPAAAKLFDVDAPALGAFKTPTLRGLPTTAPYGHGGTMGTLLEVAQHYGERGLPHADPSALGTTDQWVPNFDTNVADELPAFLEVLTAEVVLP